MNDDDDDDDKHGPRLHQTANDVQEIAFEYPGKYRCSAVLQHSGPLVSQSIMIASHGKGHPLFTRLNSILAQKPWLLTY